jgi:hypothetical protein
MAFINATTAVNRVKLILIKYNAATMAPDQLAGSIFYSAVDAGTGVLSPVSGAMVVPALQDITINNANGSFRWKALDQAGENVITTVSTNSLSGNFVLDPTTFFGTTPGTNTTIVTGGIFGYSNAREQVAFMIAPSGATTSQTPDNYLIMGTGFISALAPTVNADSPVWVSPLTIEVSGDYKLQSIP